MDLLVDGDRVSATGVDLEVPEGTEVIDGSGRTLLPGLIDSHTHTWSADQLRQALVFGVTTELDMFTDHRFAARMREEQRDGGVNARADLFSAGTCATCPGGHGTEYGIEIPTLTEPDEAAAFVEGRLAEGSDYIKIIRGSRTMPSLRRETIAALIGAAHAQGKLAVVHVLSYRHARETVQDGADGLAHLFIDESPEPDFAPLVAARGSFVIPTLTVLESACGVPSGAPLLDDDRLAPFLTPMDEAMLRSAFSFEGTLEYARRAVLLLRGASVPICAGTDAGNPGTTHGASIHRELELLVEAGLDPVEALASATSVPARCFSLSDRGRVAPGLRADLVLVRGDPTVDIFAARDIAAVWKTGVLCERAEYRARAAEERGKASRVRPPPSGVEDGLVSDFEDDTTETRFGAGWSVSTDEVRGGTSKASTEVVPDGAAGTRYSLRVSGTVMAGTIFAWAGALFSPGSRPFDAVDLSSKQTLSFWAKGDGGRYSVMLFTQRAGFMPAVQPFDAGAEWRRYEYRLKEFAGASGQGLMGVLFAAGPAPGDFAFQIDEVRFD